MNVSLCITVKNEEQSVGNLVESLIAQSQPPDEVIVVDGGSTDGTLEVLNSYRLKYPNLIRISSFYSLNIAEGRNISIKEATSDLVASADAGVQYPVNWLKNLLQPFQDDNDIDVVAGFFEPQSESIFEESVGILLYPNHDTMNWQRFLPSARSAAFKKSVWEDLNGYAEWLPLGIGEDTDFFLRARNAGYNFAYAKNATCYWRPRQNLKDLFKQYYLYSKGACISGSDSAFMLEAYGANPILVTFDNLRRLLNDGKLHHLVYCFFILCVVLAAKISGFAAGKLHVRGRKETRGNITPDVDGRNK